MTVRIIIVNTSVLHTLNFKRIDLGFGEMTPLVKYSLGKHNDLFESTALMKGQAQQLASKIPALESEMVELLDSLACPLK